MLVKFPFQTDFTILSGDLTPSAALSRMGRNSYGVVVDQQDSPFSVVLRSDLRSSVTSHASRLIGPGSKLPPTIIVARGTTMAKIVESDVSDLLDLGPSGLVVVEDNLVAGTSSIAGVLSMATVGKFLGGIRSGSKTMAEGNFSIGDSVLGGQIDPPLGRGCCTTCFYPNTGIVFIGRNSRGRIVMPWCENPSPPRHRLTLS